MGGSGSGRFGYRGAKTTVEQSLTLNGYEVVPKIMKRSRDENGGLRSGTLHWKRRGKEVANAGYRLRVNGEQSAGERLMLILFYSTRGERVELPIPLQTTTQPKGGIRYWLTCPLTVNGQACRRRTAKLYLPPLGRYFGCRSCYDLTYQSCQTAHEFDALYKLIAVNYARTHGEPIGWKAVRVIMDNRRLHRRLDNRTEVAGGSTGEPGSTDEAR